MSNQERQEQADTIEQTRHLSPVEQQAKELEQFIAELFETFVDGPLMTAEQRKLEASRIAMSVVEAHTPAVHLAYTAVANRRRAKGLPMGS